MSVITIPPSYTLRLGFCGKRGTVDKIPALGPLRKRLDEFFNLVSEVKAGDYQVVVQLINGLAHGADHISANAFLDNKTIPHENKQLISVFAFEEAAYKKLSISSGPFNTPQSQAKAEAEYERLKPLCLRHYEIDGDPAGEDLNDPYSAQSSMIVAQSDILVVCTDPGADLKPGGSIEGMFNACKQQVPVILFSMKNVDDMEVYLLRELDDIINLRERKPSILKPDDNFKDCKELLYEILSNQGWAAKAEDEDTVHITELLKEVHLSTLQKRTNMWNRLVAMVRVFYGAPKATPLAGLQSAPPSDRLSHLHTAEKKTIAYREIFDDKTAYYTQRYRSGYVTWYLLTIIVVSLSLISLGKAWTPTGYNGLGPHFIHFCLEGIKWLFLAFITIRILQGKKGKWVDKSLQLRYLAERLRILRQLAALGILRAGHPKIGAHNRNPERDIPIDHLYRKMEGHVSAAISETETPPEKVSINSKEILTRIKYEWINDQCVWHDITYQKMGNMNSFLENLAKWLSWIVLCLVGIDVVLTIKIGWYKRVINILPVPIEHFCKCCQHFNYPQWLMFVWQGLRILFECHLMLALVALIPVMVAAFNAIRNQSEAKKLSARSFYMRKILANKLRDIENILTDPNPKGHYTAAKEQVEICAQIMLDEVADWVVIYEKEINEVG